MRDGTGFAAAPRPPRRFRRRVLLVLLVAAAAPLVGWGLVTSSLIQGALRLAPPLEALIAQSAEQLERVRGQEALVEDLRAAELRLVQAELARRRVSDRLRRDFLLALAATLVTVAGAAWLVGRRLSRPVEALADGIARYARGELDHEVRVPARGDELDFLARELNGMARELSAQRARLQVTEQLAAWREVARTMAHDLKNPLTAMRMALARLTRPGRGEAALVEAVSLLQQELEMLIRMTQSFSDFARLPDPQRRPLDLAALVEEVAALYRGQAPAAGLQVRAALRPTVVGDPDQLRRAFGNLVKNALEAGGGEDGPVQIELRPGGPGSVEIVVRDAGKGIAGPIEGLELVRGLASAKATGRRGLGLPIAQKIVHDHGGRLRLVPRAPRGTEAVVELQTAGSER
jgi:two-component system, NtrC family, nitrogen regulation sensor histidine kinase NtrY